jgi:RNA-binding protein
LGHSPAAAAASELVAASDAEDVLVDAAEESCEGTPAEAEEAPRSFVLPGLPRPKLTVKERKELASYAHGLGKKLKLQQVGKFGVTPSLVSAFTNNLESKAPQGMPHLASLLSKPC